MIWTIRIRAANVSARSRLRLRADSDCLTFDDILLPETEELKEMALPADYIILKMHAPPENKVKPKLSGFLV